MENKGAHNPFVYLLFGSKESILKYKKSIQFLVTYQPSLSYLVVRYDVSKKNIWRKIVNDAISYEAYIEIDSADYRFLHRHLCCAARESMVATFSNS